VTVVKLVSGCVEETFSRKDKLEEGELYTSLQFADETEHVFVGVCGGVQQDVSHGVHRVSGKVSEGRTFVELGLVINFPKEYMEDSTVLGVFAGLYGVEVVVQVENLSLEESDEGVLVADQQLELAVEVVGQQTQNQVGVQVFTCFALQELLELRYLHVALAEAGLVLAEPGEQGKHVDCFEYVVELGSERDDVREFFDVGL